MIMIDVASGPSWSQQDASMSARSYINTCPTSKICVYIFDFAHFDVQIGTLFLKIHL